VSIEITYVCCCVVGAVPSVGFFYCTVAVLAPVWLLSFCLL
jgi:hypothetical protein